MFLAVRTPLQHAGVTCLELSVQHNSGCLSSEGSPSEFHRLPGKWVWDDSRRCLSERTQHKILSQRDLWSEPLGLFTEACECNLQEKTRNGFESYQFSTCSSSDFLRKMEWGTVTREKPLGRGLWFQVTHFILIQIQWVDRAMPLPQELHWLPIQLSPIERCQWLPLKPCASWEWDNLRTTFSHILLHLSYNHQIGPWLECLHNLKPRGWHQGLFCSGTTSVE